jgi:hypothetical protein
VGTTPNFNARRRFRIVSDQPAEPASTSTTGCVICNGERFAEYQFFRWFELELHSSKPTLTALGASQGLCERHTRRQIMTPSLRSATERSAPTVVSAALAALDPKRRPSRAECLACLAVRRHTEHLAYGLLRAAARNDTLAMPICVRHAAFAAGQRGSELATGLVRLHSKLTDGRPSGLSDLSGQDDDAELRERLRSPSIGIDDEPVVDELLERLAVEACPICKEIAENELRFLHWLIDTVSHDPDLPRRQALLLCHRHLHDLGQADVRALMLLAASSAQRITEHAARRVRRQLERRRWHGGDRAASIPNVSCTLCLALARIEERQLELLGVLLGDRGFRRSYQAAHGLCQRHYERFRLSDAEHIARDRLVVRLRTLQWEIDESQRKQGLDARFERDGDEETAWARALVQIDGRATLGRSAGGALRS